MDRPAEVTDVLSDREAAVHVQFGGQRRGQLVVLINERLRALLESATVRRLPPVVQLSAAVELRTLVVETVTDLVSDDRADPAVVGGLVASGVEERRLQDRGREDDFVEAGVVVGVHRLGGHEPLVTVDGLADLVEVAPEFELPRRVHVRDQIVAVDVQ